MTLFNLRKYCRAPNTKSLYQKRFDRSQRCRSTTCVIFYTKEVIHCSVYIMLPSIWMAIFIHFSTVPSSYLEYINLY